MPSCWQVFACFAWQTTAVGFIVCQASSVLSTCICIHVRNQTADEVLFDLQNMVTAVFTATRALPA